LHHPGQGRSPECEKESGIVSSTRKRKKGEGVLETIARSPVSDNMLEGGGGYQHLGRKWGITGPQDISSEHS